MVVLAALLVPVGATVGATMSSYPGDEYSAMQQPSRGEAQSVDGASAPVGQSEPGNAASSSSVIPLASSPAAPEVRDRRMADVLAAPCIYCGYASAGYWQAGTHARSCPWWNVGGDIERKFALVRSAASSPVPPASGDLPAAVASTIYVLDRFAVWQADDIQGLRYHAMEEAKHLREALAQPAPGVSGEALRALVENSRMDPLHLVIAMAKDWTDPVVVRDAPERVPHVIEQLIEHCEALRGALVKVRAHTSYASPTPELLQGLLASIERIAEAALAPSGESPSEKS